MSRTRTHFGLWVARNVLRVAQQINDLVRGVCRSPGVVDHVFDGADTAQGYGNEIVELDRREIGGELGVPQVVQKAIRTVQGLTSYSQPGSFPRTAIVVGSINYNINKLLCQGRQTGSAPNQVNPDREWKPWQRAENHGCRP